MVVPHYMFFIGLLVIFEATMGVLVLSGGRRAELGMVGILGMQAGLLLFGWVISVGAVLMLIAVGLLLARSAATTRRWCNPPLNR